MKSQVTIYDKYNNNRTEYLNSTPFDALNIICKIKGVVVNRQRLFKVNNGYEISMPNGTVYEGYKIIISKSIIQTYFCNKIIKECNT